MNGVTAFFHFGGGAGNIKTSNSKVFYALETIRRHIKIESPFLFLLYRKNYGGHLLHFAFGLQTITWDQLPSVL